MKNEKENRIGVSKRHALRAFDKKKVTQPDSLLRPEFRRYLTKGSSSHV